MIISKAFSGVLLSSYFGLKPRAMINSMEELIDKKDFNVALFQRDKDKFLRIMPDHFNKLYSMENMIEWQSKFDLNNY